MKRIHMQLSHSSIQDCIRQLEEYKNSFTAKLSQYVERLAAEGISVSRFNLGEYGEYLRFEKKLTEVTSEHATAVIYMINTQLVEKVWLYHGSYKHAFVNPALMTEFGSGIYAVSDNDPRASLVGAGQGTFPGQTHAFDEHPWRWRTPDGVDHESHGEAPSAPLLQAMTIMYADAIRIAKEVFGNG